VSAPGVPAVDIAQLPPDAAMVDVRETDEWTAGRAPTATHVPMSELPGRLPEVPTDVDPLYVICRSGSRSGRVVAYLTAHGYRAVNVAGGMQAWQAAGREMVCDGPAPPQVV